VLTVGAASIQLLSIRPEAIDDCSHLAGDEVTVWRSAWGRNFF
jgi:hypothetical protein